MTFRTLLACALLFWLPSVVSAQEPSWTFETDGPICSSPTLDDNWIYVGSGDGHLYALDRGGSLPPQTQGRRGVAALDADEVE